MGGSRVFDTVRDALVSSGVIKGTPSTSEERSAKSGDAGKSELMFGMGAPALGRAYQMGKAKFLGVTKDSAALARDAEKMGINLGISDVAEGAFPKGYEKVIGMFPVAGSPFRRAMERKAGEVSKAQENMMAGIGDVRGVTDIGEELVGAAKGEFKKFRDLSNERYGAWRDLAEQTGATLPTDKVRAAAKKYVDEYDQARTMYGQAAGGPEAISAFKEPNFIEHARKIAGINQPQITVKQYEGLMEDFGNALSQARKDGFQFKNVDDIRRAAKEDFANLSNPQLKTAHDALDKWYREGAKKFDTTTAKKFGRVDRNMFTVGYEQTGSIEADQLLPAAFSTKSPKAMRDLRALVGQDTMSNAVASHLENAYEKSLQEAIIRGKTIQVVDPQKFRSAVGLTRPGTAEWKTLDESLKQAGSTVRAQDLDTFIKAIEAALKRGAPDVSSFVARHTALGGGLGAIETILPVGAALHAGSPLPIAAFLIARAGSKNLSNPKVLRDMTALVHPDTPERFRDAVTGRLMRGIGMEGVIDQVKQ